MTTIEVIFNVGFFAAVVRLAVPLLLGALGEMIGERSGVINLGIEGMMLAGAFVSFATAAVSGSLWLGVIAAILLGAMLGLLMAVLVVHLRLDQTVAGMGLTMATTGLVYYAYRLIYGETSAPTVETFMTIPIPFLSEIPFVGPIFFDQYALTYLTYLLVPLLVVFMSHTPKGLALRTVGENPLAAAGSGIDVIRVRTSALVAAGTLAALAGAYLNLAAFGSFTFGIISGRGWICLALVVLGRWQPVTCMFAAILFGAVDAFQIRMQSSGISHIPYPFFLALPYIATLIAMVFSSGKAVVPASLMKPYDPEER